jgi:hypothetical protein
MNNQNQSTLAQQLEELDELYYTAPLALYEAMLQLEIAQLEQILPGFTIAFAEIFTVGSECEQHGGMRHVFTSKESEAAL